MQDYLLFNKFIMPFALQFLFWAGIAGTLYGPGGYIPTTIGLGSWHWFLAHC
jgi:hypothetical protein